MGQVFSKKHPETEIAKLCKSFACDIVHSNHPFYDFNHPKREITMAGDNLREACKSNNTFMKYFQYSKQDAEMLFSFCQRPVEEQLDCPRHEHFQKELTSIFVTLECDSTQYKKTLLIELNKIPVYAKEFINFYKEIMQLEQYPEKEKNINKNIENFLHTVKHDLKLSYDYNMKFMKVSESLHYGSFLNSLKKVKADGNVINTLQVPKVLLEKIGKMAAESEDTESSSTICSKN